MTVQELFNLLGCALIILVIVFVLLCTIYLSVVCIKEIRREIKHVNK